MDNLTPPDNLADKHKRNMILAVALTAVLVAILMYLLFGCYGNTNDGSKIIPAPTELKVMPTVTSMIDPVRLFSPNGGEIFRPGQVMNIEWFAPGTSTIQLYLFDGTDIPQSPYEGKPLPAVAYIIGETIENGGSYSWQIPSDLKSGRYFMRILCNFCEEEPIDFSDATFIIAELSI